MVSFSGLIYCMNAVSSEADERYIQKVLKDNLKLTMILEFFMSTFTFNIWIELAIIPIITIITVMNVIAERKEEYKNVHKLLDFVLAIAGFWILYETIRVGEDIVVNEKMTLVGYVKNCINVRRFEEEDADEVSKLIVRNFLEANSKDYGIAAMEELAKVYDSGKVLNIANYAHMYVFEWNGKIVGTGSISSFWGSKTESILLTIFVLPEFHGKGIGRKIINTLEQDEFYVRATRIEIPASITATEFYRKFGYDYKNGVKELAEERHYRLEKFKEVWI